MPVDILELEPNVKEAQLAGYSRSGDVDSFGIRFKAPNRTYFSFKYTVERIVGSFLLFLASPVIGVLWCLVKLTSKGPGFFIQRRVGLNGKEFGIVKLRTMCENAEVGGVPQWCVKRDARVTVVGRVLRALHLDELPQLWNVARGEMCLIGPRPERPEITRSLEKLIPSYHLRHGIKPGITGLSQVNLEPDRHINITRKKQILDLRYISEANFWLDCRMLFATSLRMVGIKGDLAMRLTGLRRTISDRELKSIGYQFDTPESELWNPNKGPA